MACSQWKELVSPGVREGGEARQGWGRILRGHGSGLEGLDTWAAVRCMAEGEPFRLGLGCSFQEGETKGRLAAPGEKPGKNISEPKDLRRAEGSDKKLCS